jgi:sugar phosphate isomerase/epimerase
MGTSGVSMKIRVPCAILAAALVAVAAFSADKPLPKSIFAKDNLIAWCIVPFDAAHRGPVERARMLKRIGITMFAYDWRDDDIPTFDRELDALTEYGIKLQSFWLTSGPNPASDNGVRAVLDLLKRRKVKIELWYRYQPPEGFDALPQDEKVVQAAKAVKYLAVEARKLQCKVGLYNHGGWYGEPENQLAILKAVGMPNVGMVYNFHHGQEQIDRFPAFFPKILPYLLAVNISGMKKEGPMIITVGEGRSELDMLKLVRSSGYQGPIGILNHSTERDAEVGLKGNMAGLQKLLRAMGDEAALKTY